MAILNLEEIDGSLDLDVVESTDTPELPLEEIQEVQEETQALEDATELLEDMEEAAQQQAVTINNIEGDASEINSVEEGEELSSVEPEFTQDDIENNPEMVQDIVSEQQAAMEAFAVRIIGGNGKNVRGKLLGKLGITAVSHESVRVNPFEAYKVTHEGLKETIQAVIKKIKHWIINLGQKLKTLYNKFRVWMAKSKDKDKKIIDEAKKNASKLKSDSVSDINVTDLVNAINSATYGAALVNLNTFIQSVVGGKGVKISSKLKKIDTKEFNKLLQGINNKENIYATIMTSGEFKILTTKAGEDDKLVIDKITYSDVQNQFDKNELYENLTIAPKAADAFYRDFDKLVKSSLDVTSNINKKIEELDKSTIKQSEEELKATNKQIKNLSVAGTFNSMLFNSILRSYSASIKVCKYINKKAANESK